MDYYTRTLLVAPVDDLVTRFDLLVERVLLFRKLGDHSSEAFDLDGLEQIAITLGDLGRTARVSMLRGDYLLNLAEFQQAAACAREAAELAVAAGDIDVALGAHLILPYASMRQGRLDEAMQQAEEALRLAQHHARSPEQGAALNLMGLIAFEQKRSALARVFLEATLEIARLNGDRALEAKSLNNLGRLAGDIDRDWEAAREYYEQTYAIVHERGDRRAEGIALSNLGMVATAQGDFAASRSFQIKALAIAREIGDPYQEAYMLINLSAVAGIQGDASDALQFAQAADALASRIGDPAAGAWANLYKGHSHLMTKDLEAAAQAFAASVGVWDQLKQPGLAAEPLTGLILVALERNDTEAASQQAERIMAHLEAGGTLEGADEPLRVYFTCYRVLETTGDPRAKTVLDIARKMLATQLSKIRDEEARRMYVENVPWRLAVQRAPDSPG